MSVLAQVDSWLTAARNADRVGAVQLAEPALHFDAEPSAPAPAAESSGGGFSFADFVTQICALAAGFFVLAVYTMRSNENTGFRAGDATNVTEEFAAYGLNEKTLYYTRLAKMGCGMAMIVCAALYPPLTFLPAFVLGAFMVVAVFMHLRRHEEPLERAYPSMIMLGLCAVIITLESPIDLIYLGGFTGAVLAVLVALAKFKPEGDEYYGDLLNQLTEKLVEKLPASAQAA